MTSISAERSGLEQVGHSLRRREQWGAQRSYTDARTVYEPANRVFIHITVTNPSNYNSNDAHARAIEAIGISRFPNTGISYNRLIMPNGKAFEAQPIGRRGAHTVNDFQRSTCSTSGCPGRGSWITTPSGYPAWNLNYNARAYVICQNVDDPVTDEMVDSIARCVAADKLAGFVTKSASIHGHRCVSSKSCPGDKMWAQMPDVERRVNNYLADGLEKEWWEMAIPNSELDRIAKAVHERNVQVGSDTEPLGLAVGRTRAKTLRINEELLAIPVQVGTETEPLGVAAGRTRSSTMRMANDGVVLDPTALASLVEQIAARVVEALRESEEAPAEEEPAA